MTLTHQPPGPPADPGPPDGPRSAGGVLRLAAVALGVLVLGLAVGAPWLVIIASISLMIFLHELGHYLTAKWAGMKVTEFFLGFGPRLWSFRRGETEYGLKAIPAGAYVKVIGMYNIDDVDPAEEHRTYRQKKYYQRLIMAAAGSTMHFVVALALIFLLLVGVGRERVDNWRVNEVVGGSAAAAAGLQPGDRIVSIADQAVSEWTAVRDVVEARAGDEVSLVIEREGAQRTTTVTIGENPDAPGRGFLGVGPDFPAERIGPVEAVSETAQEFGTLVAESVKAMGRLFTPSGLGDFFGQVATGRPDTSDSGATGASTATSDGSENRFISIYGAARLGVGLLEQGWAPFLGLLVLLNVFIGLFNLVPLLPLDGGHIAVATYERVRELFRRDGRRYFTDITKLLPVTYAVVLLLVVIGMSSLYLDIVNPINL